MVRIITDSASDLELQEYNQLGVTCIPLYVLFGDKEYQENVNLSKDQFYRLLEQDENHPRTSQPSPHTLEHILKEAMDTGDEAVVISLSSALSGTCQSIMMTKNMLEYENCYVFDGLTATGGQRQLVEYAVKLRDTGKSAQEIVEALEDIRSRITLYACMDTLEYLMRGGRISRSTYAVGTLANVKPILRVSKEGTVEIPTKMIGMRRGIDYMYKRLSEIPADPQFPIYVMYTHNRKNGEVFAQLLNRNGYDIPDKHIINVGPAIGSHIGPNACGIVYIAKKDLA